MHEIALGNSCRGIVSKSKNNNGNCSNNNGRCSNFQVFLKVCQISEAGQPMKADHNVLNVKSTVWNETMSDKESGVGSSRDSGRSHSQSGSCV